MLALVVLGFPLVASRLPAQQPGATGGRVDVVEATVPELQAAMARGAVTAVALVDAYLARIYAYDQRGPQLNAMIWINPHARAEAEALDRERAARGPRGPLHGIPIILKDNYNTADMPTSGGSVALAGLVPPEDAFQVRRLREAGAIILGKSNLHELAAGVTTISSLGGQTRNPYDLNRSPGGSSGGTGVAVAANYAVLGWGSDTCGSIRIPASHNNLFGLRPTKGLSSIDGIIPLAHTQDVAGPLARTATDLAIALDATVGPDPNDPATRVLEGRAPEHFTDVLDSTALRGARVGVLGAHFGNAPDDQPVTKIVRAALDQMKTEGAEIVEVEVPGLDSLLEGSSVIDYEFKWDLMDYLARTPGAPVRSLGEILERGLVHADLEERFRHRNRHPTRDSEEYRAALAKRRVVRDSVIKIMDQERVDVLVYPTVRRKPPVIGEPPFGGNCQLSATTGMPALSVPAGFTEDGLPIGMELLGKPLSDPQLVALGYAFEQATHHRRPPPSTPPLEKGHAPRAVTFQVAATGAGATARAGSPVVARAAFTFDPLRNTLAYRVTVSGVPGDELHAVALRRGSPETDGPVVFRLSPPGSTEGAGTVTLASTDREALLKGRLYLSVFTREHPAGAARAQLVLPARP